MLERGIAPVISDDELWVPLASYFASHDVKIVTVEVTELPYSVMNPVTHGIHRIHGLALADGVEQPYSMIRKSMGLDPMGGPHPSFEMSDDPRHWNYWKREAFAYRSSLLPNGHGLRVPRCYGSVEANDAAVVWLEELTGSPATEWPLERLARAAEQLGRWQADHINRERNSVGWLSENWLRVLMPTRSRTEVELAVDPNNWTNPLVRELFDPTVSDRVAEIWERRQELLDYLDSLDQTLTHWDFRVPNLFCGDSPAETVVIDWQFLGWGAVGQDLTGLVTDSVLMSYVPASELKSLENNAFRAYVEGLCSTGWHGDEQTVWNAYAATAALRFGLACGWLVLLAIDPHKAADQEHIYKRPIADLIHDRLIAVERSLDLGFEVLARI